MTRAPTTPRKGERTQRLLVIVTREQLEAINDFRFRSRIPSLAAAVRELLRRGLSAKERDRD
jgi:hypothetical protein